MAKKTDSLIHLRFGHSQAKEAKKDLLNSEVSLLKITKNIKNYRALRIKELNKKESLKKKIKSLNADVAKIKKSLPKIVLPKILKKDEEEKVKDEADNQEQIKVTKYGTIEDQLRQIQNKLHELEDN